jgi:GT2 family glycosyltransferase
MRVSIIIASFQRAHLLQWGLYSLARQTIPYEFETIVVNDGLPDETESVCNQYRNRLKLRYVFSGQRNLAGTIKWRVPGFAYNIGVKQAAGDILIITCAEMYHVNATIALLTGPVIENRKRIAIPAGKDDRDGAILEMLRAQNGNFNPALFDNYVDLDTHLPFLLAVSREDFCSIGGFDEDFTGIAFDDNDLVERLQKNGCGYYQTGAQAIHLFHPRYMNDVGMNSDWHYNRNLYIARGNQIVRNIGREWGMGVDR